MSTPTRLAGGIAAVLRGALQAYPSHRRLRGLGMLSGLLALPGLLPGRMLASQPLLLILAALGMGLLVVIAVIGWWALLANLLRQNDPLLARTLPGHVRALRLTLWSTAAALSALAAVCGSKLGGSALASISIAALVCAGMTVMLRWPVLALPLMIIWAAPVPFERGALFHAWQATPLLATALLVAAAAGVLHAAVLRGGPRHARVHRRAVMQAAVWRGEPAQATRRGPGPAASQGTQRSRRLIVLAYGASLRQALRRPGSPRRRLALGLGPMLSISGALIGAAGAAVLCVGMATVARLFPQWDLAQAMYAGLLFATGPMMLTALLQWPTALWATRREQTLLRLLPGTPQGGSLNRWLALRLSALQAMTAALFLALLLALQEAGSPPGRVALASLVLSPVATLALWRDWSRMHEPQGAMSLSQLPVIAAVIAAAYAWVSLAGLGVGLLAVLVLPAWLVLACWRWQVLGQLPAAWPAGRLASTQGRHTPVSFVGTSE